MLSRWYITCRYLQISHHCPEYPGWHWHLFGAMHFPPFWQNFWQTAVEIDKASDWLYVSNLLYIKQNSAVIFSFPVPRPWRKSLQGAQKYLTPSSVRVLRTIERPKDDFEEVSCLWLSICTKNVFYVERAMLSAVKKRSRSNKFWSNKWRDPTKISQ